MKYCKKCNKTYPDDAEFCSKCGNSLVKLVEEKVKLPQIPKTPTNWKLYGLIVIVVIAVGAIAYIKPWETGGKVIESTSQRKESCPFECCVNDERYETRVCQGGNYQCVNNKCVKTNCPHECCPEGVYSAKPCQTDYECVNNKCVAIDSDKDGLTDIEERQLGTNPNLVDSDGDTLNDYQESRITNTNPLKTNTDEDRYNDNVDSNPTTVNSAKVSVQILKKDWNWEWLGILDLLENLKKLEPDFTLATAKVDILLSNDGNDYTEYVKFDNVFKIQGIEAMRVSESIGQLNIGETSTKHYEYKFTAKQAPEAIEQWIKTKTTNWSFEVQNLQYKKFI